ncbi:MAG TPA: acyl-ACP thioesterase domain-containing protein [Feifaniaceae bacterium]|nr:acyl-ACP thioesterase domain-containing protein [Feifaniaceae bacterium]
MKLYTTQDRVCASRTDARGAMRLTGAMDSIQDCSMSWLESEPPFLEYLRENNLAMFLVSRQADILRLPVFGENIRVKTWIYHASSFLGYRNTVLYGEDGLPCILTWAVGAFVNFDTGKMSRIPQAELDKITIEDRLDMEYLDKKIVLPRVPERHLDAFRVRRSDIDINHHMNNAKYIEAALEFLPETFTAKRLRIEYKSPAKLGDWVYPKLMEGPEGTYYVRLLNLNGDPFAVMEFS